MLNLFIEDSSVYIYLLFNLTIVKSFIFIPLIVIKNPSYLGVMRGSLP